MSTNEMEQAESNRPDGEVQVNRVISVSVRTEIHEDRVIELQCGQSITEILRIVASERGSSVEELLLFRDGEEGPLTEVIVVGETYPRRRHHVHRAAALAVIVYYQAGMQRREFKRNATVGGVLAWAIAVFNIDPGMATEFEMAIHGQKDELLAAEHIGHLAGHHHELAFDLVRGVIANGGARD